MPGGLDQQAAGVAVAGLGDPALGSRRTRRVFGGHQPEVGADRTSNKAIPVAAFAGQPESGQRRDPAQTSQPGHHRVNTELAAISAMLYRGGYGGPPQTPWHPALRRRPAADPAWGRCATASTVRACRSTPFRRSTQFLGVEAVSRRDAGQTLGPRAHPREPAPGLGPLPVPCWGIVTSAISPKCNTRARCRASRVSVLTRSPVGRCSFEGAASTQVTPFVSRHRANPNPVGPASYMTATGPGSDRIHSKIPW